MHKRVPLKRSTTRVAIRIDRPAGLVQAPHSLAQETADVEAVQADIELRNENYAAWRDHILPNPSEMAWKQIPWLTTFKDGIVAAAARRPVPTRTSLGGQLPGRRARADADHAGLAARVHA